MKTKDDNYRLIVMYLLVVALLAVTLALCGCRTVRESESSIYMHRMALMTARMDSMVHSTSLWQQSLYERQASLVDSFSHSEVRDTSRTIFLGAKGDTIRERIVIRELVEREHTSQESTQEQWQAFESRTDSLLSTSRTLESKVDSLLREREKTAVVERQAPWYQRLADGLGRTLALLVAGGAAGFVLCRRFSRH